MKLSVLDQSPAAQDKTQDRACSATHSYWVSGPYISASIVGTAPEVLVAAIAATTQRIRVGSKGLRTPVLSPEAAAAQPYTEAKRAIVQGLWSEPSLVAPTT